MDDMENMILPYYSNQAQLYHSNQELVALLNAPNTNIQIASAGGIRLYRPLGGYAAYQNAVVNQPYDERSFLDRLERRVKEIEAVDGTMPEAEVELWRKEAREIA